ncbi:16S rRNA (uracil(1498)-N(3))-methyltransferase [Robertkochia solimangrovi]|uniref:16S rRNA (uracil(1498)-N(3))-methyltransferase n=1 Tax=Robertkochia solimangrovi TaxID=2213046 RepID=UPI00117DBE54|nr:16S rRNA (uracil(1498)-N(3))-methyltransferase [Robertkochia solimangrovi]TRZ42510.1 16S rRNA (uracil(1498)-N(3))-methyltransferase [Robertkochia solimangrovi]
MQLFYAPDTNEHTSEYEFDREESKHIIRVLRRKAGDILHITNGKGWLFEAEIISDDLKHCRVKIIGSELKRKKNYYLHMAVAPTKMNDRYEWFLEKATEIGIDEITPVICAQSERKVVKTDRYEKIILSAMKQSLNCYLPKLNDAIPLSDFISTHKEGQCFIAHCNEQERFDLKRRVQPDQPVLILIGPEGDFTEEEVSEARAAGYIPAALGENRLRTETAAIVACHTVALINQ